MNRVDVGNLGGADHRWNIQVAARTLGRPDADGLVGKTHVQAVAIRFRINGDGLDAQVFAGADYAYGDFAAIGDQDFLEHVSADELRTGLRRTPQRGRSPSAWPRWCQILPTRFRS
jgi:hypothetical protein